MKQAFFVDLPNFYSQITNSKLATPSEWRDYFTEWFDFDRLATCLTSDSTDVWVFHSNKIGSKEAQISDKFLSALVKRFNSQKGVTARNVNIKGTQHEFADLVCPSCSVVTSIESKSEKGIDTSLIVHLFDTADSWDVAHILSGDADFVPAVAALRRRGKIVNGLGIATKASDALIRECFQYTDLTEAFLLRDLKAYRFCREDGIVWKYLHNVMLLPKSRDKNIWVRLRRTTYPNQNLVEYRLMSSDNRDIREWFKETTEQFFGSSQVRETSDSYTMANRFVFDEFSGPIVTKALEQVLVRTPFNGHNEHHTPGGLTIYDTDMVHWWNDQKKAYEIVYPADLADL